MYHAVPLKTSPTVSAAAAPAAAALLAEDYIDYIQRTQAVCCRCLPAPQLSHQRQLQPTLLLHQQHVQLPIEYRPESQVIHLSLSQISGSRCCQDACSKTAWPDVIVACAAAVTCWSAVMLRLAAMEAVLDPVAIASPQPAHELNNKNYI